MNKIHSSNTAEEAQLYGIGLLYYVFYVLIKFYNMITNQQKVLILSNDQKAQKEVRNFDACVKRLPDQGIAKSVIV